MTAIVGERAWCPTCRTKREVLDVHAEGHYDSTGEVGYVVTDFACGHDDQSGEVRIGPAPGGEAHAEALAARQLQARQATEWHQ